MSQLELRQQLIDDIQLSVVNSRAPLGIVKLTLDEGHTVEAVGVVYGLTHDIAGPGFTATLFMDQYNQRIRVLAYAAEDYDSLILKVRWLAEANGFDKIIVKARHGDWMQFLRHGYVLEAVARHYYRGEDAFIVSKFRSQPRLTSASLMDEILLIEKLMNQMDAAPPGPVPQGYSVRLAHRADIPELIALYQSIFATYPSPLIHASYLELVFAKDSLFAVCTHDGKIVAAASAELHPNALAAELTDCATQRQFRGKGLMSHILDLLEGELNRRNYICAYTMARARSFGMNAVFRRLGYDFAGRLINNCDIFGDYEDMNIWVKPLPAGASAGMHFEGEASSGSKADEVP